MRIFSETLNLMGLSRADKELLRMKRLMLLLLLLLMIFMKLHIY